MPAARKISEWVGKEAPDFKVKDQNGDEKSLKDFSSKYLLLYFYPKDLTPGCTTQACNFRDGREELTNLDLEIVGVSCDPVDKHQKFIEKHELNFTLLADEERDIVNKYGVWVEKSMYGKKYMGIQRDSFLINKEGKIIKHYIKVKPKEHINEVIKDMKNISEIDVRANMPSFYYEVHVSPELTKTLSPTKLNIVEYLALAFSNKSMAAECELSVKAIEHHVRELGHLYKVKTDLYNPRVRIIANLYFDKLIDFYVGQEGINFNTLNHRLQDTLSLITLGFSLKSMASVFNISVKAVEQRISQLYDIFNIDTDNAANENSRVVLWVAAITRTNMDLRNISKLFMIALLIDYRVF